MSKRELLIFGCGVLLGMTLLSFANGGPPPRRSALKSRYEKLNVFSEVLAYLENDYVDKLKGKKLIYNAIQGMLKDLDAYTVFTPSKKFQEMKAETSGEHGGPGLGLRVKTEVCATCISGKKNRFFVTYVVARSPAARKGILVGDEVLKLSRKPIARLSLSKLKARLRGRPGTLLFLTILSGKTRKAREVRMFREQIRINSVKYRSLGSGYHYVHIKSFQYRTARQLKAVLTNVRSKGKVKGLVIDLRNNPGGLVDPCVKIADMFIRKGLIVYSRGRKPGSLERSFAHPKHTLRGFPITVLINGSTASASEIVAGALQDYGRAVLVGSRSFGKGSVQNIVELSDGAGLKLTVARYFTPLGRQLSGKGLTPDSKAAARTKTGGDGQLAMALRLLRNPSEYKRAVGKGLSLTLRRKSRLLRKTNL